MARTSLTQSNQLIFITGARGTGKTNLAATFAPPSDVGRVFYHDSENSANRFIAQIAEQGLAFGHYGSLRDRFSDLPDETDLLNLINDGKLPWVNSKTRQALVEYYKYILEDLEKNLIPGKYDVYVHDTIEKLESGMAAWVESNKSQAGVTNTGFGKLWTEGVYPLYEQFLSSIHARGVKTIILTSHLKTPWEGSRPVVGKVVPSGKKILYFMSQLMIWLVKDSRNLDGAPAGLIMKERLASIGVNKESNEWQVQRRLPRRIPHATWADIENYLHSGYNAASPLETEVPSADEHELMEELTTDKQMELMILDAKKALLDAQQTAGGFLINAETGEAKPQATNGNEFDRVVREYMGEHPSAKAMEIKMHLESAYSFEDVTIPRILLAMRQA